MPDLLVDMEIFLIAKGFATTDGIDIFRDFQPENPDHIVVISEYSGMPTVPGVDATERNLQITVRDQNSQIAKAKIWEIFNVVDKPEEPILQLTDTRWVIAYAKQSPFKIEVDERGRVVYGFNVGITTSRD